MQRDLAYFAQRARDEREAADRAACEKSRSLHLDLAERYEDVLRAYQSDRSAA